MRHSEARKLLDLEAVVPALTRDIIMEAFRKAAWKYHPDGQGQAFGPKAAANVDKLVTAKETLLKSLEGADFACKQCGGLGSIRSRMGIKPCGACKGTGETLGR